MPKFPIIPINTIIITEEKDTLIILKKFGEENAMIITITGEALSIDEGINSIKLNKPTLVFVDIPFEDDRFFDRLDQLEFSIPKLVFISAHENQAVKAFKHNAIDFISKPIDFNALILAVYKVIKRTEMERSFQNQNIEKISYLNTVNQTNDYIAVSSMDKIELIRMSEILYCKADGKYTWFFLINEKKIMSSRNLGEYATLLDSNYFFRIHHSHIINLRHIAKILKKDAYYCELSNGISIPVAKRRQEDFNKFIKLKE